MKTSLLIFVAAFLAVPADSLAQWWNPQSYREEAVMKKCKIPKDASGESVVGINPKRPKIIDAVNKLTRRELEKPAYGQPKFSFQNRNSFAVTAVAIAFTSKKDCPLDGNSKDYEATVICADTSYLPKGVGGGVYGSLPCQNDARNFGMGYCVTGIRVEAPSTGVEVAQIMDRHGLCD